MTVERWFHAFFLSTVFSSAFLGFEVQAAILTPLGVIQPIPKLTAALPSNIKDGSTISLNCGTTYYGSLNLENRSNVTVQTSGTCERAVITPAVPVSGWTLYKDKIYVVDAPKEIMQVFIDSQLAGIAHYPNSVEEAGWLVPSSTTPDTIIYSGLPSNDIVGATVSYRGPYPWALGSRKVSAYDGKTMTVPANQNSDLNAEDSPLGKWGDKFYLEGKLWMLDSPGEWVWSHGKLYLWMPDGSAPDTRVLASPNVDSVINARGSTNVVINNVRVVGGFIGINGGFTTTYPVSLSQPVDRPSKGLQILHSEVAYSNWSGIYASKAEKLKVNDSDVTGALANGVYARQSAKDTVVTGSRFTNINKVGMHKGSDAAIFLNGDLGATVTYNLIKNSGKAGIFIGRSTDSMVIGNNINGACLLFGDCGAIYAIGKGRPNLNTRIERNVITNSFGTALRPGTTRAERYAIFLDDAANGITVRGNRMSNNSIGMSLHGTYNNLIADNFFSANYEMHVNLTEGGYAPGFMQKNDFYNNTFEGPVPTFYFYMPSAINSVRFSGNTYVNYPNGPILRCMTNYNISETTCPAEMKP
jgi:parallel beta-helix repeat protein